MEEHHCFCFLSSVYAYGHNDCYFYRLWPSFSKSRSTCVAEPPYNQMKTTFIKELSDKRMLHGINSCKSHNFRFLFQGKFLIQGYDAITSTSVRLKGKRIALLIAYIQSHNICKLISRELRDYLLNYPVRTPSCCRDFGILTYKL